VGFGLLPASPFEVVMRIRFIHQALIGTHVYGQGEIVEADSVLAGYAISQRVAVEHAEPVAKPAVREAVSTSQSASRKAVARS
jgi:hypothetical protein